VGLVLKFAGPDLATGEPYAIALVVIVGGLAACNLIVIGMQPGSKKTLFFKVNLIHNTQAVAVEFSFN
jgi:hypothetical protein